MDDTQRASHQYAWDWFRYHAEQRLRAFRFFLILLVPIGAAYLQSMSSGWEGIGTAVGASGIVISVAFFFLEIRNEELVNCGREALDQMEADLPVAIRADDDERNQLDETADPITGLLPTSLQRRVTKHRFWLKALLFLSGVTWFVALLFAARGYTWC